MSQLDDFVSQAVERHRHATTEVRNGDATSFVEQLSTHGPVTLFPHRNPVRWAGPTLTKRSSG
jgi:hypothetical protein